MTLSNPIQACAQLVERGDPDRFLATMAAPPESRGALFTLYAFNLEIARAPWVTKEPLIARMRLQFWRDLVEGEDSRAHEVAAPLAELIAARGLSRDLLIRMIDAREAEIGTSAPFADEAALWSYLRDSGGALLALAVEALGGTRDTAVEDLGTAQALANYLLAVPALETAGRQPVPDGRPEAIAALAREGLNLRAAALERARRQPRAARPALLATWNSRAILSAAAREPGRVGAGALGQSEFARRASLLGATLFGL